MSEQAGVDTNPQPKCDHICLLDDGHVERGEVHQYGYELPSPRQDVDYRVLEALRLTVEYVGLDTLRPSPGWSWYDVLSQRPEYADWLDSMVNPKPVEIDPNDLVTNAQFDGGSG